MVMEALSPQSVGREFVRQYYTLLNKAPLHLHRFYSGDSSFVHGGLDKEDKMLEPVHGQQEIHEKIMQLNFRDCKAKIRQVDAHATLASGVVVQVLGELSNNHQPMRRFMQTFVLAPQTPKKYYVYNDIFRYQDEVFNDINQASDFDEHNLENEKNFTNDGIETVSILDGVQSPATVKPAASSPPHINGGNGEPPAPASSHINELSPRVPIEVMPLKPEPVEEPEVQEEPAVLEDVKEPEDKVVAASPEVPSSTTSTSEASNEKPTYANLFKKSAGGGAMVASGPLSLPPAGFGKSASNSATSQATSSSSSTLSPPTTTTASKEGSPGSGFQGSQGKPFRGGGDRGGPRGGGRGMNNSLASRDRYHPSRESVSSNVGEEAGGERRGGSRIGMNTLANYPDSHQVFVGNLPHYCQESNLEALFSKFGKVVDVRINTKGVAQSKNLPDNSQKSVPNFGFVVFEDEKTAIDCLSQKPINLPNGHRLNVETKKKNNKEDGRGAFGGSSANRGQGGNFDRGSQEQLGGVGRGGSNANRGNSRGGSRGGGRGGFSGGRGGGNAALSSQGGAGMPNSGGNNTQQRTTYTRRS